MLGQSTACLSWLRIRWIRLGSLIMESIILDMVKAWSLGACGLSAFSWDDETIDVDPYSIWKTSDCSNVHRFVKNLKSSVWSISPLENWQWQMWKMENHLETFLREYGRQRTTSSMTWFEPSSIEWNNCLVPWKVSYVWFILRIRTLYSSLKNLNLYLKLVPIRLSWQNINPFF